MRLEARTEEAAGVAAVAAAAAVAVGPFLFDAEVLAWAREELGKTKKHLLL